MSFLWEPQAPEPGPPVAYGIAAVLLVFLIAQVWKYGTEAAAEAALPFVGLGCLVLAMRDRARRGQ